MALRLSQTKMAYLHQWSVIILLCEKLEVACITQSGADTSLELTHQLRQFRGVLRREELQNVVQITLGAGIGRAQMSRMSRMSHI
jgi:hypothetical protein